MSFATATVEIIRHLLPVQKHRLDEHLEMHAEVLDRIAQNVTKSNSKALESKEFLSRLEARLAADFRESDPKLTVAGVEGLVRRSQERTTAYLINQRDRAELEEWSGLLEAWRSKGYSMKTLADLYAAQYFSLESFQRKDANNRGSKFSSIEVPDSSARTLLRQQTDLAEETQTSALRMRRRTT